MRNELLEKARPAGKLQGAKELEQSKAMRSAVGRPDGHNVCLGQVLVMGTQNGPWLPVIRLAKEKLESLWMIN